MINLHERMLPTLAGVAQSDGASNWATEAGPQYFVNQSQECLDILIFPNKFDKCDTYFVLLPLPADM